jgi:hypothetical protein
MNTASKLGPHTQTDRGTCPGVRLWVYFKRRKKLDLIQTQVAQRRMQRVGVYARALRLNQHVKWAEVEAAKLRDGGVWGGGQKNWCRALLLWSLAKFCLRGLFPDGWGSWATTCAQHRSRWARDWRARAKKQLGGGENAGEKGRGGGKM